MSLTIDSVTKRFGSFDALKGISLRAPQGAFVALLGPSGSGKTTLLRILGGLEFPDAGSVHFADLNWLGVPARARRAGFVFQHYALFRHMTVAQNIAFGLSVKPRRERPSRSEIARRVEELLALVQLEGLGKRYPSQLSGGQRQRVALARALAIEPRILLLDEPFGALDAQTRLLMGDEVLRLWRRTGATVLLITHALDEAAMLSDRVGAMSARPGCFIEIIETNWPRERDSTIVGNAAFGEITGRLWERLRGESLKALGHSGASALAAQ